MVHFVIILKLYSPFTLYCGLRRILLQQGIGMKHPSDELEGLYLAREDEQICLLYYQVFVGMLEININSAEVLYKKKEEIINE